jgi:hypothetical protein
VAVVVGQLFAVVPLMFIILEAVAAVALVRITIM